MAKRLSGLTALFLLAVVQPAAQESVDDLALLDSLYVSGSEFLNARELSAAEQRFEEGLALARKRSDSLYTGRFFNGLGSTAFHLGEYEQAVKQLFVSLDWLDAQRHPEDAARARSNLGTVYASLGELDRAAQFFEEALDLSPEESVSRLALLTNLAALEIDRENYGRGLVLLDEAVALAEALERPRIKAIALTNASKAHRELEQWDKAIEAGEESLRIRKSIGEGSPVETLNNLGYSWRGAGRPDLAESYYDQALVGASGEERLQVLLNLANLKRETDDLAASLEWFDAYDALKDSLADQDYKSRVAELAEKYESEKRQLAIDRLEEERSLQQKLIARQRILVLASLVLLNLFAVLGVVWVRQTRVRQALDRSRMRQRLLRAQLNPHFIFNALQTVQNFVYKNDATSSQEYLDSFGRLIRKVLEHSDQDSVPLDEEMDMLQSYLQLQQHNHGHAFDWDVTADGIDDPEDVQLPAMLVQPFVENAVIHGAKGIPGAEIEVNFRQQSDTMEITVSDTGRGVEAARNRADTLLQTDQPKGQRSMGREIVNQRVREYNRQHGKKISMAVRPLTDDDERPGTQVTLHVPVSSR